MAVIRTTDISGAVSVTTIPGVALTQTAADERYVRTVNDTPPDEDGNVVVEAGASDVTSVNGETGAVVLSAADVGASPTGHGHAIGDTTGLQTALDGKSATGHGHTLADISDAGTAAAADTGDFATAAQGALADTATQPADLGDSAALDVGTTAGTVAAGDDSRMTNARTPTAHATSHQDGGSDELALDASQITTGVLAIGRLATGTPDGTKFVRDDDTLAVPAGGGGFTFASWTPALTAATTNPTLGSGSSAVGRYAQSGKMVFAHGMIKFGSSGASAGSGGYRVSLPVAAYESGELNFVRGHGYIYDGSTLRAVTFTYLSSTTSQMLIAPTVTAPQFVAHNVPWAWGANAQIWFQLSYEAA